MSFPLVGVYVGMCIHFPPVGVDVSMRTQFPPVGMYNSFLVASR